MLEFELVVFASRKLLLFNIGLRCYFDFCVSEIWIQILYSITKNLPNKLIKIHSSHKGLD